MTTDKTTRVSARTARLTAATDEQDGPPWRFSGIAVAAGDILHMDDGTPVLFTAEELRKAAETQAGEPLTRDHPEDEDGDPKYPPDTGETYGKVPRAGWLDDEQAVGYEATTHDEELAQGVQGGSYEVSVHPTFRLGEQDPETGAYRATDIEFRDLSVVSKGDSPSNTAEWGANQALASLTASQIDDALTAADNVDTTSDRRGLVRDAVRATLSSVGVDIADDVDVGTTADNSDADGGSTSNEEAESSVDPGDGGDGTAGADTATMSDTIETLVDEHGFTREALEAMSDDDIERLEARFVDNDDGRTDTPSDGDDKTIADMTVDELGSALREQGFVTEADATDLVAKASDRISKGEKVDAIIANSDDYDEDDREDLMASADALVEREHNRLANTTPAQTPGSAGLTAGASAPTFGGSDGDEDLDEYGTGIAGEE